MNPPTTAAVGGQQLFLTRIPAVDAPQGTALLVHGFTVDGGMFRPVQAALAQRHELLVPDLRGGGRSAQLEGSATVADHVADLRTLLDHLGLHQVHLLGYSMGGTVAQQFALQHPERVRSLVLACTFAHKQESLGELAQAYLVPQLIQTLGPKRLSSLLTCGVMREYYGFMDDEVYRWYQKVYATYTEERLAEAATEIFRFDSRRYLPKLQVPTLVIGGTEDKIVPPYHSRMLAKLVPGAELELFAGGGHGLIFTHAQQFAAAVAAHWLRHNR